MVSSVPIAQRRKASPEPYRFNREEYDAMIAAGILDENDRVELIAGEILTKMPIGPSHASTVKRLNRVFSRGAEDRCVVSIQDPIALNDLSEPEPDLALLVPRADHYENSHPRPAEVLLIVEVAESSLEFDRDRKIPLYAAASIPEVWLIDLTEKCLFRFRNPQQGRYTEISRHAGGDRLPLSALPNLAIELTELGL